MAWISLVFKYLLICGKNVKRRSKWSLFQTYAMWIHLISLLMMRTACLVYGSFKTICNDIFDGVYILEVNQSQKREQIHMSFLNAWLFHIFKLCPGINIFLTKGCFKYNFSVSFKRVADQILWKSTRLYDSLLVK